MAVGFIRDARSLIGLGQNDLVHQVPHVELVIHEVLRQRIQQLRIDRRICRPQIIDRVDDATVEKVAPDAIRHAAGEVWILWSCQPLCINKSSIRSGFNFRLVCTKESRWLQLLCPRVSRESGRQINEDCLRIRRTGQTSVRFCRDLIEETV